MSDSNSHNVRSHLRLGEDAYDDAIIRFIPGYQSMLEEAASAVAAIEPAYVMDLGAGSGSLSEAILDCSESAVVELLDVDPEMLTAAQSRLARFGKRAQFSLRSFHDPLSCCNAFAASLSLHHIETWEAKTALFKRVYEALLSGGIFVNADINMPEQQEAKAAFYRHWANHMASHGISGDRAQQYFIEWSDEDTYFPLDDEMSVLQAVGFSVQCVFSDGPANVVVGRKE